MTTRPLKVLYLGGTGTISASCARGAVAQGMDVSVLNRGRSVLRPLPPEVTRLTGDVRDPASFRAAIEGRDFDVVVNFLAYTADDAREAVDAFRGRTGHYLHISTAQLYQKPPRRMPYSESTARRNPFSTYARNKIAAEDVLTEAYILESFPVTIVRPSHTYDEVRPPLPGDWTVVDRLSRGAEVVVPGDGTSLWTLTHASDFAQGLLGLFANPNTFGEAFHITSDDVYCWNEIYDLIAAALGVEARLVHVPSEFLPLAAPDWSGSEQVLADLRYSVLLDNSKIRRYVPGFAPQRSFHRAVDDLVHWRQEHPTETAPDPAIDAVMDRLVGCYHAAEGAFLAAAPLPGRSA
ncbi:MAG: NAD-dependent epimerase/dehydratase family protein [Acidimicrobiales bacterium]|jgi:nucleoside-diphosphate-sugar epimerase